MERYLGRYSDRIYALMRIVVGFLYLLHGVQKIFGVLGGTRPTTEILWAAGFIESIGGILICLGLFTSWVAFICSGEMAVAYFMVHLPRGFFPIQNNGELAAFYSWVFLYMASKGSGPWSLDSLRGR